MSTRILLLVSTLLVSTHAAVQQRDFTGVGHIHVLASDNWKTATPASKIGCLNDHGKLIADEACGTFSKLSDYPWTLSSKQGNCTFEDTTQQQNTDSQYGSADYAWSCKKKHDATIGDELYTIDGFPFVFLCFGDVACFYDSLKAPSANETLPLWPFRWGSQQQDITPGHIQLQLMWEKVGDLPKRVESTGASSGRRLKIWEGWQVPLLGKMVAR